MKIDRRALLAGTGAATLLAVTPVRAAEFAIDWQGLAPDPAVQARIERQVAMVRAAPVRPDILAFWAKQTIHVTQAADEGSRAGEQVFITRAPFPDDNPVLLHELIHRWHFAHLANTSRVAALRTAFADERAHPHFPADAYMYRNIAEYLAMCASVVIHGRAARPPFTREQVRDRLPATYAFIVTEFGVRL